MRYSEPFRNVISAFLLNSIVSALMVGLVNLAKTIPAMQAWEARKVNKGLKVWY